MNRRDALSLLVSLPAATRVTHVTVSPSSVIVLECPGSIGQETADRLHKAAREIWPDNQCVVLRDGMTVKVLDSLPEPGRK